MSEQLREYVDGLNDLKKNIKRLHNRVITVDNFEIKFQSFYGIEDNRFMALELSRSERFLSQDFDNYLDWLIKTDNT